MKFPTAENGGARARALPSARHLLGPPRMAISGTDRVATAGRPPLAGHRPAHATGHARLAGDDPASEEVARVVATAFAREFARLRYPGPRIMRLFSDPFYSRAHAALRRLGERAVGEIVAEAVRQSRPVRCER